MKRIQTFVDLKKMRGEEKRCDEEFNKEKD
jgi:hypothetical protein